ncbi:MAG: ATP-binding protein [Microbacterium sp.]
MSSSATRKRRRWSLQTRLILTVVSFVALILLAVGLASGTILRSILAENLNAQVSEASSNVQRAIQPSSTAAEVLEDGRQESGTLLVLQTFEGLSGAYVDDDGDVVELTEDDISSLVGSVEDQGWGTIALGDLGEYRVQVEGSPAGIYFIVGMPTSELSATVARILTTVALLTVGGLLLLAAIVALVIRHALRPLRAVATTAVRVASQPLSSGDVTITERVPASAAHASDEIGAVGAALNTLLDHVDTSLTARQRNEERMRAFVADASHELRTPLAAIRGYSELSLRSLKQAQEGGARATKTQLAVGAERSQEGLERIQAASLRMTTLVEDLLLLARLDEGKELVYGAVDVTRIVVDAVADARAAGPDHEWIIDVPEEAVIVAGDATRLHQVVANLLTNARVHTPEGVKVTASVEFSGNEAIVRITDNGPGIDPAVAGELFERFARADTSRARQTGGTGLGLSIAKAIVTAHHGTIGVTSAPGQTVFEIRLPARPAAPETGSDTGVPEADPETGDPEAIRP